MNWRDFLPRFHPLKTVAVSEPPPQFSYCETETASGGSRWHIRLLTNKGRKLGGGADTPALCGVKVAWDLKAPILNPRTLLFACRKCAALHHQMS